MGVGLIFLSVLHAIFFHFYYFRYQDQKLPMSWNFRMGFFWQVGGARLYRDVLARARTRLAEYQKIAEDLDDETRKKIPLSLVNQWKAELSELEKFTGRRVDVRASFKT
jgi:hypothetical protein